MSCTWQDIIPSSTERELLEREIEEIRVESRRVAWQKLHAPDPPPSKVLSDDALMGIFGCAGLIAAVCFLVWMLQ